MRDTARRHDHAVLTDRVLQPLDVHEDLALEHVERLFERRVLMKRRRLPADQPVLEHRKRAVVPAPCLIWDNGSLR